MKHKIFTSILAFVFFNCLSAFSQDWAGGYGEYTKLQDDFKTGAQKYLELKKQSDAQTPLIIDLKRRLASCSSSQENASRASTRRPTSGQSGSANTSSSTGAAGH